MIATILLMLLVGAILCAILIAGNEILARRSLSRHWPRSRLFPVAGHWSQLPSLGTRDTRIAIHVVCGRRPAHATTPTGPAVCVAVRKSASLQPASSSCGLPNQKPH